MSDHKKWEKLLADYLAGSLVEEDKEQFEGHLKECPDCQKVIENARNIKKELNEAHTRGTIAPIPTNER